jgi:hypothetical protein
MHQHSPHKDPRTRNRGMMEEKHMDVHNWILRPTSRLSDRCRAL